MIGASEVKSGAKSKWSESEFARRSPHAEVFPYVLYSTSIELQRFILKVEGLGGVIQELGGPPCHRS